MSKKRMTGRLPQCDLYPFYEWKEISGFSDEEIKAYQHIIEKNAHMIPELSQLGGIDNAAGI